ncbi:MAG: hypothetical protein OXC98_03115 [bacterium]|nr:hypothetical protein [Acidimicrobiia bacterium]MCY4649341.1 hypothetical protein [bacterium]
MVEIGDRDPVSVAVAVSETLYRCADDVVVADPSNLDTAAVAAQLAVQLQSPLLYFVPGEPSAQVLTSELHRLQPERAWLIDGMPASLAPAGVSIVWMPSTSGELIRWIESHHPTVQTGYFPTTNHPSLHSMVITGGTLDKVLAPYFSPSGTPAQGIVIGAADRKLRSPRLWLIDPRLPAGGLVIAAAVSLLGEGALYWNPEEVGGWNDADRVLEEYVEGMREIWIVGDISESSRWLLETTLTGRELPGGGRIMFPDRRLLAFYGGVSTPALGVLGEQDPPQALKRMTPFLEEYAADGVMTIPTFEIITTLATELPGTGGNYSAGFSIRALSPWIQYAAQEDVYVVLDLQPGRSDFLTQARRYEELLKLPHVGLALDPEWRLGPNQVHLRQIGSVTASEVNSVSKWLSELVREEKLPQKLFMIHQFRTDMIHNRESLTVPPELAVVIHMDGQGPLSTKYNTWAVLQQGSEDRKWLWGWKNFFDEDSPMATPQEVLDLQPSPVFVSYQ